MNRLFESTEVAGESRWNGEIYTGGIVVWDRRGGDDLTACA